MMLLKFIICTIYTIVSIYTIVCFCIAVGVLHKYIMSCLCVQCINYVIQLYNTIQYQCYHKIK